MPSTTDDPTTATMEAEPQQIALVHDDAAGDAEAEGGGGSGESQEPAAIEPLTFPVPRAANLVRMALESRAADDEKLAKKVAEEGHAQEARTIAADAQLIRGALLPQLRAQREFTFDDTDVHNKLTACVGHIVRRVLAGTVPPPLGPEDSDGPLPRLRRELEVRERTLTVEVTRAITAFAEELYTIAFARGLAVHDATAENAIVAAAPKLTEALTGGATVPE